MTGDGWPDLMGQPSGGSMRIYPGNGRERARGRATWRTARSAPAGRSAVGRWDGDGAPDSLFRKGSTLTHATAATARAGSPAAKALSGSTSRRTTGWSGSATSRLTGHADLIVREKATGDLYAAPGDRDRVRSRGGSSADGMAGYDLAGLRRSRRLTGSGPWRARRRTSPRAVPGRRGRPGPASRRVRAAR